MMINKKSKIGYLTEDDCFSLLNRYNPSTIITLLKEVSEFADVKIDWNTLVTRSSTGISNAREYQMLWRHLAYREPLFQNIDETESRDDDSDLEFELKAVPAVNAEASSQAAECAEVVISSGLQKYSRGRKGSTTEAPSSDFLSLTKQQVIISACNEALHGNEVVCSAAPNKKKRQSWTIEEEKELIAAVQKHGEGNWVNILKNDFKHDRTPSQLSQRWSSIKKRSSISNFVRDDKKNNSVMYDEQLATRKAISMALQIPMIGSLSTLSSGPTQTCASFNLSMFQGSPLSASEATNQWQKASHLASPQKRANKPQATSNNIQVSPVTPNPLIQAAAFAAGGRIIDPSAAASLLKAAQSKNVFHIRNGESPISKSLVNGAKCGQTTNTFRLRPTDTRCTKSPIVPTPQTSAHLTSILDVKPELTACGNAERINGKEISGIDVDGLLKEDVRGLFNVPSSNMDQNNSYWRALNSDGSEKVGIGGKSACDSRTFLKD